MASPRPRLPAALRLRWPLVLLLASIGLTAVAAIGAQRAVRSQQAVAARALRDYASFAAWSYAQHLGQRFDVVVREALGAVNHGDNMHTNPRVPRARDLAHYLPWDEKCTCHRARNGPNPDSFFALKIGDPSLDIGVNTHPSPMEGWEVDRPMAVPQPVGAVTDYSLAERRWIVDTITRRVRALGQPDHGYTIIFGAVEGSPRVIAYTLMPTAWGDTMVYGARYEPAAVHGILTGVLDEDRLLPATFTAGRHNGDILALRVRAPPPLGPPLLDAGEAARSELAAHLDLPRRYGALSIDAAIRPEFAGTLIIGGLPRSRLPFLLGLLALAAMLSVVSVAQLRREGELARLRADFVSSISHELRTPLAQIRLYVDTLRLGRARTAEQREWSLAHIDRETTRLGHLVENVLCFSRLGRGGAVAGQPVDVTAETRRIVEEFRPLAAAKQVRLETAIHDVPPIPLAADALRHLVLNLLDNALKYGPTGQTVTVSVGNGDGTVRVAVSDEGPGVPAAERDAIWRAFARGGAARSVGGSGIGLTIVREVAEQHGGRAWVEDADTGGARFVVALPVS